MKLKALVDWLLERFCDSKLHEAFAGDLKELYDLESEVLGVRKAQRRYLVSAVSFLWYHRLRRKGNSKTQNNMSLIKNYLKVSWRDLSRNRTYTAINLTGLVSAMTVALLIFQYVLYETGFDRFHEDKDRIYRVVNDRFQNGKLVQHGTITYPTIGPTMHQDFPEVEAFTRMTYNTRSYIAHEEELYLVEEFLIADENFLDFFSFEMTHGDKATALDEPYVLVFSESFANRIVKAGQAPKDLIGEVFEIYGASALVTGIIEDVPAQSHLQFDMLVSYKTFIAMAGPGADNSWQWSDFYHYVKLGPEVEVADLDVKLADFGSRYFKDGEVSGGEEQFYLQPLSVAHMDISMEYEIGHVVDGEIVWTLLIIASFILLVAWINYINLATSRALQRAKEVGIRKAVGAGKRQIVLQFIVETLLINLLALCVSMGLVWLSQPFFNQLTGLSLDMSFLWYGEFLALPFPVLFAAGFVVLMVLVSFYPAFLVANFKSRDVVHGRYQLKGEVAWLRKALVVFQFVTAVALINGAMAISDQIDYMLDKDLGLDIENTLVIYGPAMTSWDSTYIPNVGRFKDLAEGLSGVKAVSCSNRVAGNRMGRVFQVRSSSNPEARDLTLNFIQVDHGFDELFGLEVLAGRGFDAMDHNYDPNLVKNVVINHAALAYLGIASESEAIGAGVNFWDKDWTVVGVVNDFHQLSLHDKIEPLVLIPYYGTSHQYSVKLDNAANEAILANLKEVYDRIFPGNYFDYYFLEDQYQRQYQAEFRLSQISRAFTVLSLIMVVLGLYGLTTMTLERKVKEIGIRKVLGARLSQILYRLTKDFVWLMFVALFLGIPLSLYLIGIWKDGFSYSTTYGFDWVVFSTILVICVTSVPILLQGRRVARNNPVKALRDE